MGGMTCISASQSEEGLLDKFSSRKMEVVPLIRVSHEILVG